MKQKFLELAKELKNKKMILALSETSTPEELRAVWNKFLEQNQELCTRIKDWGRDFKKYKLKSIFSGEKIKHPMEIVAIIYIIGDSDVSECEIFENCDSLVIAIRNINNDFALAVADFIKYQYIHNITAEDIFTVEDDDDDDDDDFEDEYAFTYLNQ